MALSSWLSELFYKHIKPESLTALLADVRGRMRHQTSDEIWLPAEIEVFGKAAQYQPGPPDAKAAAEFWWVRSPYPKDCFPPRFEADAHRGSTEYDEDWFLMHGLWYLYLAYFSNDKEVPHYGTERTASGEGPDAQGSGREERRELYEDSPDRDPQDQS